MVRVLSVVLIVMALLAMASTAFAYRLIVTPVAEVLPEGVYKLEFGGPYNGNATNAWLPTYRFDGTIHKGLEIAIKGGAAPDHMRATNTTVNLNWQIAKETKDLPGYGIGVWNGYDSESRDAIEESMFVGAFKTVEVPGLKFPVKAHLCAGTKQLNGMFGGVIVPLSKRFSVAAEYCPTGLLTPGTKSHLVAAIGYNQTANWRFKVANAGGDFAYGIVYTNKWLQK